ncbi:MFS transporter [Oerskovia sp. NPDC056781]|uniref:MFS transporter n=1 Tax=Oerskovia sp. NPDC056781 TaxID=3345942 RepID=UPI00366B6B25
MEPPRPEAPDAAVAAAIGDAPHTSPARTTTTATTAVEAVETSDATPAPAGAGLSPATQRTVLVGMVALVLLGAFEALAVATAMHTVATALDGMALYAVAFAGSIAASVVGMVAAGRWCDRFGPSPSLWGGVGMFLAGLVVSGLAPTMGVFVAGRVVQGLGTGMYIVALYVLVARVFPEARRPAVFAAFAAAWVVPSLVGPVISGLMVQHLGWRWVFLAVPVLAVPAVLMMRPGLRAVDRDRREVTSDAAGNAALWWAVAAAVGIGLLHFAGQQEGVRLYVPLVVALALVVVAVPRLLPRGTARAARGLPSVIAIRGLVAAAFTGTEVLLPLLLQSERALSPTLAGGILTFGAIGWSVGAWLRGKAHWGWSHAQFVLIGSLFVAGGISGTVLLAWSAVPPIVGMLAWTFAGLGMGLVHPTLSVLTLALSPEDQQGANSSALQVSDALSAAIALAVTGSMLVVLREPLGLWAYVVCFGVMVSIALFAAFISPRTRVPA